MKTSDPLASRILTIAVSISIVFCSLSLLIFSIGSAQAVKAESVVSNEKTQHNLPWDETLKGGVGLGTVNNTGYFVVWGTLNNMLYKVDLAKARDWYAE
ncbi:MAG: hypothetical protein SH857_01825 [Chitinophagales bacterium]|nr:hypothetical protein [Chitinophagales bacterium]